MSRLEKSATEKIADPEARGDAERAYKSLQKAAADGKAAENKTLEAKPAEEIEEEGTEGVDLYRDSCSLAYGTFPLLCTKITSSTTDLRSTGTEPVRYDDADACHRERAASRFPEAQRVE